MAFVYLLWTHGEDGPEGLVATLDKSKVAPLAEALNENGWFERVGKPHLVGDLESLLERGEIGAGIYSLMSGWGGLHLQVVDLA